MKDLSLEEYKTKILACAILVFLLVGIISLPQHALALKPFGGRILAAIPCLSLETTSIHVTVGLPTPGLYVWTPLTITYLWGPPIYPGKWVLGNSLVPYVCVGPGGVELPGLRMIIVGSSVI